MAKVSFDFDGVLHSSVIPNTLHPICYRNVNLWEPRYDMLEMVAEEAETNEVYIVTSRNTGNEPEIMEFVIKHDLPISGIICGDGLPKTPNLIKLGSIRHYDDDIDLAAPLKRAGIEFIYSLPPRREDLIDEYGEDYFSDLDDE